MATEVDLTPWADGVTGGYALAVYPRSPASHAQDVATGVRLLTWAMHRHLQRQGLAARPVVLPSQDTWTSPLVWPMACPVEELPPAAWWADLPDLVVLHVDDDARPMAIAPPLSTELTPAELPTFLADLDLPPGRLVVTMAMTPGPEGVHLPAGAPAELRLSAALPPGALGWG